MLIYTDMLRNNTLEKLDYSHQYDAIVAAMNGGIIRTIDNYRLTHLTGPTNRLIIEDGSRSVRLGFDQSVHDSERTFLDGDITELDGVREFPQTPEDLGFLQNVVQHAQALQNAA